MERTKPFMESAWEPYFCLIHSCGFLFFLTAWLFVWRREIQPDISIFVLLALFCFGAFIGIDWKPWMGTQQDEHGSIYCAGGSGLAYHGHAERE
jgi:hypothetical protein